ncbi:MAG: radical SAM family heme chaperone HemW [Rhodospirillales bacterium]
MHPVTTPEPLALYIHWPFCLAKCPYCDFNSHVRDSIPQHRFAAALRRELAFEAARLGPRPLGSIFFGGGTPSLMQPETVAALIGDALHYFVPAADIEITLEANPTSVELGKLAAFREAGVNRLSLGVQALDDTALRFLGRRHNAHDALAALEFARATFPRLSFDLIYARPGQTLAAWRAELRRALALAADHLSLYQLTIEPGTAFEALHRNGTLVLPDEECATTLYDATADAAAEAGLLAYEISNYAAPGAESRHNLAYWRYNDYAGIGPGAHGRISLGDELLATRRHRAPEPWAERVERDGHGSTAEEPVPRSERAREALLMGLRLAEGIELNRFETRTGISMREALDLDILDAAQDAGYLTLSATHLIATADGRRLLDALLPRLVK